MNSKPIEVVASTPETNEIPGSFKEYKESTMTKPTQQHSPREVTPAAEQVNQIPDRRFDEMQKTITSQGEEIAHLRQ